MMPQARSKASGDPVRSTRVRTKKRVPAGTLEIRLAAGRKRLLFQAAFWKSG